MGLKESLALFLKGALRQLEDALEMIVPEQRAEYDMASRIAPRLFVSQVDPVVFLRRNDFNPCMAAQRLVAYRSYRKQVFQDRGSCHWPCRYIMGCCNKSIWICNSRDTLSHVMHVHFTHVPGSTNPADILSKHWGHSDVWPILRALLFCPGDTMES